MDTDDWTFVLREKEVPCDGVISHWLFWAKRSEPFRGIVWREKAYNQYQIVGINNIPASSANQVVNHTVPETERFSVLKGDLLGFAFTRASLAFQTQRADTSQVGWVKNRSPYSMASGEIHTIVNYEERAYSLAAIVSPAAGGNIYLMTTISRTEPLDQNSFVLI